MNPINDEIEALITSHEMMSKGYAYSEITNRSNYHQRTAVMLRKHLALRDQHHALTLDRDAWKGTAEGLQDELRAIRDNREADGQDAARWLHVQDFFNTEHIDRAMQAAAAMSAKEG